MNKDDKFVAYLLVSLIISLIIIILVISLIIIILVLPLTLLEFLSLEIVGEPPINGRTWMEGVNELGGEISMRFLAILGILIIALTLPFVLEWEKKSLSIREVEKKEIILFFIIAAVFFIINLVIGYLWWDPDGFLGMGSLFFPSILSLFLLGLSPLLLGKIFHFGKEDLATSTDNMKEISICMIIIAFGYGLISCIWHCCAFFEPKIFFFFFIIKLVQLWAMCTFFFKYGLKLFLNKIKPIYAYAIVSTLFGLCYPWHTWGFALTFIIFGFLLCYLTRKTDSYLPGLILLYFAYIFHAGIPWNGAMITFFVIYPISIGVLLSLVYLNILK